MGQSRPPQPAFRPLSRDERVPDFEVEVLAFSPEALRLSVHRGRPLETRHGRKKWRSEWAWAIRSALAVVPAGNRQRFDSGDLMAAFQGGGYAIGACAVANVVPEPVPATVLAVL